MNKNRDLNYPKKIIPKFCSSKINLTLNPKPDHIRNLKAQLNPILKPPPHLFLNSAYNHPEISEIFKPLFKF